MDKILDYQTGEFNKLKEKLSKFEEVYPQIETLFSEPDTADEDREKQADSAYRDAGLSKQDFLNYASQRKSSEKYLEAYGIIDQLWQDDRFTPDEKEQISDNFYKQNAINKDTFLGVASKLKVGETNPNPSYLAQSEYLKSSGYDPQSFFTELNKATEEAAKKAEFEKKYQEYQKAVPSFATTFYGLGTRPGGEFALQAGAKAASDIPQAIPKLAETVGQAIFPEITEAVRKKYDSFISSLPEDAQRAYMRITDPAVSPEAEAAADVITVMTGAGLGKKVTTKVLGTGSKAAIVGGGVGATAGDIFGTRDKEDIYLLDLANLLPEGSVKEEIFSIAEGLAVQPNDTNLQARGKQLIDSVGLAIPIAALGLAGRSILKKRAQIRAAREQGLTEPPVDTDNAVIVSSNIVEEAPNALAQRNRVTEIIAAINTGLGRGIKSDNLPKPLKDAFIKKEAQGFEIEIKQHVNDVQKAQKEFDVSNEDLSRVLSGEDAPEVPNAFKRVVEEKRRLIMSNESKIKDLLGIDGELGLAANKEGGVYFTRTFEANNNPAYLKRVRNALSGRASDDPVDAEFLGKIQRARTYFDDLIPEDTVARLAQEGQTVTRQQVIDGVIESEVSKLSKENRSVLSSIFQGAPIPKGASQEIVKIMRSRKELDRPLLDLLGEVSDPLRKLKTTLENQNRLISEVEYIKAIEDFAKNNMGKTVDLGGLFKFLPTQKTTFSRVPLVDGVNVDLTTLSNSQLAKFGTGTDFLNNIFTTKQMANWINNGVNLTSPRGPLGSAVGNVMARIAGYGQATQTALDIPAYLVNTYGALQSFVAGGFMTRPQAFTASTRATRNFIQQFKANDPAAVRELKLLKEQGVIDTDVTGEIIAKNANLYGDTPTNLLARTYTSGMKNLGRAYGQPDTYFKLIAHQSERITLKKIFPREARENLQDYEDRIFKMASDRVRDMIPTYSQASPIVRELSKLPFGTYAMFPAEVVRTSKNILKYGVKDTVQGISTGNLKQAAAGLNRLASFGITATGMEYAINNNNKTLGIDSKHSRVLDVLGPDFARGNRKYFLEPVVENPDGDIMTRYASSGAFDTYDILKTLGRNFTASLLSGKEVTELEVDQAYDAALKNATGPFVSPKFVYQGIFEALAGTDPQTGKPVYEKAPGASIIDKAKRFLGPVAESLTPGSVEYLQIAEEALASEKLRGEGKGLTASGFPQNTRDITTWGTTGIRPQTVNMDKAINFSIMKDIGGIDTTENAFKTYLKQLKDAPYSPKREAEILEKYREYQDRKLEAMQNIHDKISVVEGMPFVNKDGKEETYSFKRIIEKSAREGFGKISRNLILQANEGTFIPDNILDKQLIEILKNKEIKDFSSLIEKIQNESISYYGRPLKRER